MTAEINPATSKSRKSLDAVFATPGDFTASMGSPNACEKNKKKLRAKHFIFIIVILNLVAHKCLFWKLKYAFSSNLEKMCSNNCTLVGWLRGF